MAQTSSEMRLVLLLISSTSRLTVKEAVSFTSTLFRNSWGMWSAMSFSVSIVQPRSTKADARSQAASMLRAFSHSESCSSLSLRSRLSRAD